MAVSYNVLLKPVASFGRILYIFFFYTRDISTGTPQKRQLVLRSKTFSSTDLRFALITSQDSRFLADLFWICVPASAYFVHKDIMPFVKDQIWDIEESLCLLC